jgi:hypothetical protein
MELHTVIILVLTGQVLRFFQKKIYLLRKVEKQSLGKCVTKTMMSKAMCKESFAALAGRLGLIEVFFFLP